MSNFLNVISDNIDLKKNTFIHLLRRDNIFDEEKYMMFVHSLKELDEQNNKTKNEFIRHNYKKFFHAYRCIIQSVIFHLDESDSCYICNGINEIESDELLSVFQRMDFYFMRLLEETDDKS